MADSFLNAISALPLPVFIGIVAAIVFVSTGGIPVPISATLLIAGAFATVQSQPVLIWLLLLIAAALSLSGRDLMFLWLSRQGANGIARIFARVQRGGVVTTDAPMPTASSRRSWFAAQAEATLGEVEDLCRDLLRRGWLAIALTRLSPLATPLDIAAGALHFPALAFAGGIIPGRFVYTALYLGAGAISGRALRTGNFFLIVGTLSTLLVLILIGPRLIRRWSARQER